MDISSMSMRYYNTSTTSNNTENIVPAYNSNAIGWIFNLIVVLPENLYVMWLILSGSGKGLASDFFSLNLTICELFLCLQSLLSLGSSAFPSLGIMVAFLIGVSITGRPLFQCMICIESYQAVIHPFMFLKFKALKYRVLGSGCVWLVILLNCIFASITVVPHQLYFFMCASLCQALLALTVKLLCSLAVLRALKQSGPGEKGKDQIKENLIKRRAFHIIVMILMATVVTYAGYLVAALVYILTNKIILPLWTAGHVFFVLAGLVQPLLYLHRTGKLPCCNAL